MSEVSSSLPGIPVLLRWYEGNNLPKQEFVLLIENDESQVVLSSPSELGESTDVHLIGKNYSLNGIVRSCRAEGGRFFVKVCISSEASPLFSPGSDRDPGVLIVDDFLTEEQESQILNEIAQELQCGPADDGGKDQAKDSDAETHGTAAFGLLGRFTIGSGTVLRSAVPRSCCLTGTWGLGLAHHRQEAPSVASWNCIPGPGPGRIQ